MYGPIWDGPDIHLTKRILFQDDKRANNFLLKHVYLFPEKKNICLQHGQTALLIKLQVPEMQLSVVHPSKYIFNVQCDIEHKTIKVIYKKPLTTKYNLDGADISSRPFRIPPSEFNLKPLSSTNLLNLLILLISDSRQCVAIVA